MFPSVEYLKLNVTNRVWFQYTYRLTKQTKKNPRKFSNRNKTIKILKYFTRTHFVLRKIQLEYENRKIKY